MRKWIPLIILLVIIGGALFTALNGPTTYSDFQDAFLDGADCAKLIDIRNDMEPKDPDRVQAGNAMRSVGCYSRNSQRR